MSQSGTASDWVCFEIIDILRHHLIPSLHGRKKIIASCRLICRAWRSAFFFADIEITPALILDNAEGLKEMIMMAHNVIFPKAESSSLDWFARIAAAKNPSFVSLQLMFPHITDDRAKSVCELLDIKWAHLRSLSIATGYGLPPQHVPLLARAVAHTPNSLESLSLASCSIEDHTLEVLLLPLHDSKTLRALDLTSCGLYETSDEVVVNFIKKNRTITSLNLSRNYSLFASQTAQLCDALAVDTTLRELNLSNCSHQDSLYQVFESNHTLTSLISDQTYHPSETLPSIFNSLQHNTSLRMLKIGFDSASDDAPRALGNFFKTNTSLRQLVIRFSHSQQVDFGPMIQGMAGNTTLTALDVSRTCENFAENLADLIENGGGMALQSLCIRYSIFRTHATRLFQALKRLPSLQRLTIRSQLGPESADAVVALVASSSSLRKLSIYEAGLGNQGMIQLCEAAVRNSTLRYLVIGGDEQPTPVNVAVCNLIAKSSSLERLDFRGSYIPIRDKSMFEEALANSRIELCQLEFAK
jgi:hypothetical protein